jgi:hypothetical protein
MLRRPLYLLACSAIFALSSGFARADTAALEKVFQTPPDDARINVRWWWFGPAVTKTELAREMQSMKDNGIGGFEVQPTYPLALDGSLTGPNGPLKNIVWMSPEFLDMLNFTAGKAKDLGLQFNLTLGSGWPYGGPMFSADEGAGALEFAEVVVPAGAKSVAPPQLRPGRSVVAAYIGEPGNNAAAQNGGGFRGRGRGRGPGVTVAPASMKLIPLQNDQAQIPADAPANAKVVFAISGRTGMQVKRPAVGAEGNVIDHLSPTVVDKFISDVAEKEIAACGPNPPHSIFCDSLEVAGEDWTDTFFDEFQKRRGYDLKPLLPALLGDSGPKAQEIRHDWGQTLTEMFDDNFNGKFKSLAHAHNSLFREQAYGSPSAGLLSYINTDLPEGEGYQWHQYRATRYAASASHLLGVPVTSSETFTWIHSAVFRAVPLDIKAEADLHFIQGVNQIVCHGYPYTAEGAPFPGWSFYAAGVFDEQNPWYLVMPDLTKYLQRMSAILRQGQPANDVALYLANDDAWANFRPGSISLSDGVGRLLGNVVPSLLDGGYDMDFFDDGILDARGKVDGGTLAFGDVKYKTVVLAGVQRMPLSTLKKLEQFADAGGTVVASRSIPSIAPGYKATDADNQAVQEISNRLFKGDGAKGIFVQNDADVPAAIAKHLAPDLAVSKDSSVIGFIHRHTDGGELYFVANTSNQEQDLDATFRATGHPERWDAMTGKVTPLAPASGQQKTNGTTTLHLALAPYESEVVVFTDRELPPAPDAAAAAPIKPLDISTGWSVKFDKPLKGTDFQPTSETMDKLVSWTDNDKTKHFSGTATYEKTVTVDNATAGASTVLSFGKGAPSDEGPGQGFHAEFNGPVRDVAVVTINGKRAGAVFCPPYQVDITGLLKPGANQIDIQVANTSVNAISAKTYPTYDYKAVTEKYGNRFQPQGMPLLSQPLPSGILGSVTIESK